jgi:hypothetical protein
MEGVDLVQRFIEDATEVGGALHGPHAILLPPVDLGDAAAKRAQLILEFASHPPHGGTAAALSVLVKRPNRWRPRAKAENS